MAASPELFSKLADALGRPSKAYRAAEAGLSIPESAITGYMTGQERGQKIRQYQLLNTPLGAMYSDPSQIPFGLTPNHTVKDLLTLAPAMENYVPGSLIKSAAQSFGSPVNDGSSQPPAPIPGSNNPAPPPGTTALNDIQGTGSGDQNNVPQGTSPTIPPTPSVNVPPGGMGMKGFQSVVLPALKAGQEERHFNQTQANEDRRQQNQIAAGRNRTMAGETAKIAPSLTEAGTIQDDINALLPLYKGYSPIHFMGNSLASLAAKSGSATFGTRTMQTGKQIQQIVPALAAKVNYLLNKRFNSGEASMLQQQVVPNAGDDEANAMQKIANLRRLTAVMQGGDINALQMVASSLAGRSVRPMLPTSSNQGQGQNPPNSWTGDPEADAAIQRIMSSTNLNPKAKQARINAVRARSVPHG